MENSKKVKSRKIEQVTEIASFELSDTQKIVPTFEESIILLEYAEYIRTVGAKLFRLNHNPYRIEHMMHLTAEQTTAILRDYLEHGSLPALAPELPDYTKSWPDYLKILVAVHPNLKKAKKK